MSRSHKARYDRYPHYLIWWLKNVRFESRQPSPRERTTAISAQLEEYLRDLVHMKLPDRASTSTGAWLGRWQVVDVGANAWRVLLDPSSDVSDSNEESCYGHDDYDYDDHFDHFEDKHRFDNDDVDDNDDVPCTDPRWVDEYLGGADTGYEDGGYDRFDFIDRDTYEYDDDDDDLRGVFLDGRFYAMPSQAFTTSNIAGHRDRERLRAGNRHYRSHHR